MKSLSEFLKESMQVNEGEQKGSFEFNFKDLPNAEDTMKSLEDMCTDKGISFKIDDTKFKLSLPDDIADNKDKVSGIQDVLQQYSDINRKDQKNSSDDSFAQKTKAFMLTVKAMNEFIDRVEDDEENKEEDNKKEEDKKDKKDDE